MGKMNKTLGLLCVAVAALLPPSAGMAQQAVRWEPTLESAQRLASQNNRLVLVYFCGPSCVYCKRMEAEVLSQPLVAGAINADFVAVKVVADQFPTAARQYGVTHLPTTVVLSPQGQVLDRKEGFIPTNEFVARIGQLAATAKRRGAAVYAQIPAGTPPAVGQPAAGQPVTSQPTMGQPPLNQPSMNQPLMNQPAVNPPAMNQPAMNPQPWNRPAVNQPVATQPPPFGQGPMGPTAASIPSGIAPPYGGTPSPIASPPAVPQLRPQVAQQPFGQQPIGPTSNNVAPPAPAGNFPLGLDGCCAVSLVKKQQWVAGDRRWGVNHRGRLYLFAGPEEQRLFFADPDRYAPVVSGNDIVLAAEQGRVVSGIREFGVYYQNRVYLFSNDASRAKFEANPAIYANQALEALRAGANQPGGQLR
jgi:thioredoxin-related protein